MRSLIAQAVRTTVLGWLLPEQRTSLENPATPLGYPSEWLLDIFSGGRTDAGLRVSELSSLQVSTVFACVQLISSAVGCLPLHVFEWIDNPDRRPGKRIAFNHDSYDLLRYEPNPEMTSFTFRKTLQCHALLWGNCYAEVQRDNGNRPVALWPRNPARTRPVRLKGELIYKTSEGVNEQTDAAVSPLPSGGSERLIEACDMLHIPGLSLDGRLGQSVIELARQAVGLSLATEKFGAKYFGNGARPGGILKTAAPLADDKAEVLKNSWQAAQGGENAHKVALLPFGVDWQSTANKPEESQFLETREFQKHEICSVFSVPPHMIGETKSQNRANTEQIGLEFTTFTLSPWLEAWMQELKRKLFAKTGRAAGRYFPKFETRQLTMPDADSRRNFYATIRQWGIGSCNDVRELEDMNPIDTDAADALWMPINMVSQGAERPAEEQPSPEEPPAAAGEAGTSERLGTRLTRLYWRVFRDALVRLLTLRAPDERAFRRAFGAILASIAEQIDPAVSFEDSAFAADYLRGMARRVEDWRSANGNLDAVAEHELRRAVKAISIEVLRAAGEARAKQLVSA